MKTFRIKHFLFTILAVIVVGCGGGDSSPVDTGNPAGAGGDEGGNSKSSVPIVIIGPSTVYIASELNAAMHKDGTNDNDGSDCRLEGWGQRLNEYAVEPNSIYNFAHPGAGSSTFTKTPNELRSECDAMDNERDKRNCLVELYNFGPQRDHYWAKAKEKMGKLGSGILLIQFGANEKSENEARFKGSIRTYINEARALKFTPVLITEIEKRIRNQDGSLRKSRGNFPKWMKEIAQEENLRLLDLNKKSYDEYSKLNEAGWDETFGNCINRWGKNKENTHFESKGAKVVASWIKDLACKKSDSKLCKQLMGAPKKFTLSSKNFIPTHNSPQLSWKNVPKGTKSFAIVIDDHSAKDSNNRDWIHWVTVNIDKESRDIAANSKPLGSFVELNSNGSKSYGDPAFPEDHTYVAHIYALEVADITKLAYVNTVKIYKPNGTYDHKEFEKIFGNFILEKSSIYSK